jgi:hypothetical protein
MKLVWMYRDFFSSLRFKNSLVSVLVIKLALLWAIFYFFYDNPYKASPHNAPSAIAEKLKPQ